MAAADNLLCYYLFGEAAGVTRDNGEGTAALDAVDTGDVDYPLSATSGMGDGSLLHTGLGSKNALSVVEANLPSDFPGKASGDGTDYTAYIRFRTQAAATSTTRLFVLHATAFKGWYIAQAIGNDDRDIHCVHTDDDNTSHTIIIKVPDHNTFNTVILRYKDGVVSAWLNGAKDATEHTVTGPKESPNLLFIGNDGHSSSRSPDAYQDELVIYARALTDTQNSGMNHFSAGTFLADAAADEAAAVAAAALAAAVAEDLQNLGGLSGTSITIKKEFGV